MGLRKVRPLPRRERKQVARDALTLTYALVKVMKKWKLQVWSRSYVIL